MTVPYFQNNWSKAPFDSFGNWMRHRNCFLTKLWTAKWIFRLMVTEQLTQNLAVENSRLPSALQTLEHYSSQILPPWHFSRLLLTWRTFRQLLSLYLIPKACLKSEEWPFHSHLVAIAYIFGYKRQFLPRFLMLCYIVLIVYIIHGRWYCYWKLGV